MHKNARLTPKGRVLMLARLEAGQHQRDVAQAMGVSLTTLKKWVRRYGAEGPAGLLIGRADRAAVRDSCAVSVSRRSSRCASSGAPDALSASAWGSPAPVCRASSDELGCRAGGIWSRACRCGVTSANIPGSCCTWM